MYGDSFFVPGIGKDRWRTQRGSSLPSRMTVLDSGWTRRLQTFSSQRALVGSYFYTLHDKGRFQTRKWTHSQCPMEYIKILCITYWMEYIYIYMVKRQWEEKNLEMFEETIDRRKVNALFHVVASVEMRCGSTFQGSNIRGSEAFNEWDSFQSNCCR